MPPTMYHRLEPPRAATVVLELEAAIGTAGCTAGADGATATADPACPAADTVVAGVAALTAEVFPESISRFSRFRSARISDATCQRNSRSFSNALVMILCRLA